MNTAITISTDYPDCGSVVAFIGNIDQDKKVIDTTVLVAHQATQVFTKGPGARFISHDTFTKIG